GDLYLEDKKKEEGVKLINKALEEANAADSGVVALADTIQINTLNSAWGIYENHGYSDLNLSTQSNAISNGAANGSVLNEQIVNAANYNIGLTYLNTDPSMAVQYFKNSEEITKKEPKKIDHIKAVERLSEAYEKSGEYEKALEKYKEYVVLVDSIKQSEIESKLKNELLSTKYRIQETRIAELEIKQKEKELAIKTQRRTIIGLILGIVLFFVLTYFLVKNIRQKQRSNTLIKLASLRSQMNPHFIFNSLNSVNGFISNNDEIKANRYISDFSKLMRTVLNNSNSPTVTLSDELNSLGIYLALEHSRFDDKFDYQLEVDSDLNTEDIEVPPMLIQPYIENAVWHGLRYKDEKGFLKINVAKEEEHLLVTIEDNGIGRKESQKLKTVHQRDYKSTGIENTKERIRLLNKLHNTHFEVNIIDLAENETALGTRVEITLPTNIA
ncbi:MAG: histidine kinase, partial [Bacteroidia bacterium]|nr:histidine kinase [Bacteroidia bacterium]